MDLLIYTGETNPAQSLVTSASDLTRLDLPDDLRQLVLGTVEPLTVKFLSAASTYESFSADPSYVVVASLGYLTAEGLDVFAETTLSTAIADGKSGNLSCDTAALSLNLRAALVRPYQTQAQFVLQISVTDPNGNRRVWAQAPVWVNGRVTVFTPPNVALPSSTYLTAAETASLYLSRAAHSYAASSNSTGNTTVTPASSKLTHTEEITFTGSAGTRIVVLDVVGRSAGDVVILKLNLPSTASIVVEVRDATSGGTLLASVTTDGTAGVVGMAFTFNGTAFTEPWLAQWCD